MDETPPRQEKAHIARPERTPRSGASKRRVAISRLKRRILKHVWFVRAGLITSGILLVYLLFVVFGFVLINTPVGRYAGFFADFVFTPQDKIESLSGRTNVLVLGKGGEGHEAPDLTDTIIFASVSHPTSLRLREVNSKPSVTLISLSRDIWVPELRAKLNSTYYWGNQKQKDGGLILAKSTVEKIVGTPVHYGVVVDFSGFKKIIDALGGVEIEVERAFTDEKYPIAGREDDDCEGDPKFLCRYETVKFEQGRQLMDGETALKFARSRNAEGDEGTDFARAARQQKVIAGIRSKALSREIIMNPKKVIDILRVAQESVETDIDPSAFAILARRVLDARDNIFSKVLPEELLENPPISRRYDNLYVFIPKADPSIESGHEWDEIHKWIECVLENGECEDS